MDPYINHLIERRPIRPSREALKEVATVLFDDIAHYLTHYCEFDCFLTTLLDDFDRNNQAYEVYQSLQEAKHVIAIEREAFEDDEDLSNAFGFYMVNANSALDNAITNFLGKEGIIPFSQGTLVETFMGLAAIIDILSDSTYWLVFQDGHTRTINIEAITIKKGHKKWKIKSEITAPFIKKIPKGTVLDTLEIAKLFFNNSVEKYFDIEKKISESVWFEFIPNENE